MFEWFNRSNAAAFSKTFKVQRHYSRSSGSRCSNVATSIRIRLVRLEYLAVYPLEQLERMDFTLNIEPGTLTRPSGLNVWDTLEPSEPSPFNGLNPSTLLRTGSAKQVNLLNGCSRKVVERLERFERLFHSVLRKS
jgi:hypothetical protein